MQRTVGHAGTRLARVAQVQDVGGIVERLLGFLETGRDFVTAEAVIQLKDLLRRYPAIAEASLSSVSNITPEASACLHPGSLCRNRLVCVEFGASSSQKSQCLAAASAACSTKTLLRVSRLCRLINGTQGLRCLGALCRTLWSLRREQHSCGSWASMGQNIQVPLAARLAAAHHQLSLYACPVDD